MTNTMIIGGASGMGLALARTLLMAGDDVTIAGRSEDRLAAVGGAAGVVPRPAGRAVPLGGRAPEPARLPVVQIVAHERDGGRMVVSVRPG